MKKLYLLTFLFFGLTTQAQLVLENYPVPSANPVFNPNKTPAQIVAQDLVGNGVIPFNVKFNGSTASAVVASKQVDKFSTNFNLTTLGFTPNLDANGVRIFDGSPKGMLLTTGESSVAFGPNNIGTKNKIDASALSGDADLDAITTNTVEHVSIIDFDFVATGLELNFDFIFASEEYPEYSLDANFNDVFGFFLSGPGVVPDMNGAVPRFTNSAKNIALVPTTNIPVSIFNVNNGSNNTGPCTNCTYYVNNGTGNTPATNTSIQYDGFTKVIRAASALQCGQTYHIKLAIGNVGDNAYDSAVFIKNFAIKPMVILDGFGDDVVNGGCEGDVITLNSGLIAGTNVFVWTHNGVLMPSATGPTTTVTSSGTYQLTVYTSTGCQIAKDDIVVTLSTVATLDPQNIVICDVAAPTHTFNINQNAYMLGALLPSEYNITYHVNNAGAPGALIPNGSLAAYSSPGTGELIWVVAEDMGNLSGTACTKIRSFSLTAINAPSGTFSYPTSPFCFNDNASHLPSMVSLTPSGTYTATPAGLNLVATTGGIIPNGSTPGTYTVNYDIPATVSCPAFHTQTSVTINPNVTPNFTVVAPICSGTILAALPTTSTNGVTGTWSPAINNTTTTTYTFTPTAGLCATTQTMTITVNPNVTPTFTAVAPICSGAALAALPTTSTEGITGAWTPAINNTTTTTYTFTPTAGVCAPSQTMTIVVNPIVTPAFTAVAPICSGDALAALPTTSTNGVTGTWAPAMNNTATTTYTFTPTAGQCAVNQTMTITVNPNVTPTFTAVAPICSGAALAALPTTSTNGITGTWSPAINNTATTTYTFTPTAGQCATTQTMTITVNPNVTPTFTQVAPICSGAALAALPTTSTNGITGTWAPAMDNTATTTYTFTPTAGLCATTQTMTIVVNPIVTPAFTAVAPICSGDALAALPTTSTNGVTGTWAPAMNNTATTTYTFTPTAGQCATTQTMTITVNPNVTPTFTAVAPICSGAALAALPTTSTNGITGTWSPAMNNTATTTYTFTPTAGQCATTQTMTITVNPNVTPTFTQVAPICSGDALATLPTTSTNGITGTWAPAMNNTATTTYTFTPTAGVCATTQTMTIVVNPIVTPAFTAVAPICSGATLAALPTTSTNGVTGTWAPAMNNTATTTYTFTPTAGQCATTQTMTITVNPNVTPTFTAVAPICSGATLAALPTTSNNGITGTWAPAINNTATTTYTFTPTAGQCATTQTMTITVNPNVIPTFTQVAPICSGAALAALPTTSNNGITGTWAPAINNTATTTYTFTPTAGVCATTQTMTIVVNPIVTPAFTQVAPICSGATLAALPTTSNNGITGTWSPAMNNTATTTYTFTPTAGQCAVNQTMTITVNPIVTPTFTAVAPICSGAALAALPTTSNNGITGVWSPAMNNTATTMYTFVPTAGQCATNQTMTITVNPNVTPTFTQVAPICSGAALAALPTTSNNGITGTWAPAINNTATTTYTFTPTAGVCATTQTMTIVVNPIVTPAFTQVAPICSGATLAALPTTSTNGITGVWSPAMNNTATTTYTFTPNAGQCAVNQTMTITVNPIITPAFAAVGPICSGTATTLPTTSTNGITGTWSPVFNNTATTTYTFTPSAGQCASTQTMSVTVTPKTVSTFTQVAPICFGDPLAPLPTTSNNGVTGTWAPGMNNSATTAYTFTPSTGECATTQTMTIVVNPLPNPTLTGGTICLNSAGVPISTYTLDSGLSSATYTFEWYNMATTPPTLLVGETQSTYVATAVGIYGVKATGSSSNCSSAIVTAQVVGESAPQAITSIETSDYFAEVQTITVNVTPAGNYEYQVDNGSFQNSNVFTNVGSGTHTIIVRNECGSIGPETVTIIDYPRFFTPNGDGYHDQWNISALSGQAKAKIYIFDRFGKLLKQIQPSSGGWDGTFNQQNLPATDYWFVVYYNEKNIEKEFKSHFALKR